MSLALLKIHDTSLSTVVAAAMVAGIFISILLGNRLNSQFVEISQLSAEAAFARAEERALAERLTIARDLHDSLAKSVHGIRMMAETLNADLEETHHGNSALSRTLFESADDASREARLILDGLRVSEHRQSSLIDTLIDQASRWGARTGVEVICSQTENTFIHKPISSEASWHIQRILGEILTNVEKHSRATRVVLNLRVDSKSLTLESRDNGVGLSSSRDRTPVDGHYGIAGMFERAHILNATLTMDGHSTSGGVHIILTVPFESLVFAEGAA